MQRLFKEITRGNENIPIRHAASMVIRHEVLDILVQLNASSSKALPEPDRPFIKVSIELSVRRETGQIFSR